MKTRTKRKICRWAFWCGWLVMYGLVGSLTFNCLQVKPAVIGIMATMAVTAAVGWKGGLLR